MTHVSTSRRDQPAAARTAPTGPAILGIWRIGEIMHEGEFAVLSLAQPADAAGSPRWDYVIKRSKGLATNGLATNGLATTGSATTDVNESRRQIAQFIAATSEIFHPNLVPVLDASSTGSSPYLVMPHLEGETMQTHIESEFLKPLPVALWLVRQMAQALDALHSKGWIHGDVKPENAIVGSSGHVTLVDLGFAARIHTVPQRQYRGTPAYSSPESLSGEMAAMPAMDVFSLGRVLWQWMTRTERVSQSMLEPVAELVERMVSIDSSERPTAAAVAKQLLRLEIETLGRHIGPHRRAA